MTVAELIALLRVMPSDATVVVDVALGEAGAVYGVVRDDARPNELVWLEVEMEG